MQITEAILHGIQKQTGVTGPATVALSPRTTLLPIDGRLNRLADGVLAIYGRTSNGYGTFGADQALYQFPVQLAQYVGQEQALLAFSNTAMALIARDMSDSIFATGGYVLFLRYTNQARDWLMMVVLKLKEGTGIDQATLELNDSLAFDINHLHEAARIDLAKWQADEHPYLSFVKGKSSGNDVSKYFRKALGCTEYIDAKHHTETALKAFVAYAEHNGWELERKQRVKKSIYDYCEEKHRLGEPANLAALSVVINDQEPDDFVNYVRENDYSVGATFSPHPASYKRLKRLSGKSGNVSVSFDVSDLEQNIVRYNPQEHSITITSISTALEEEIVRTIGNAITPT